MNRSFWLSCGCIHRLITRSIPSHHHSKLEHQAKLPPNSLSLNAVAIFHNNISRSITQLVVLLIKNSFHQDYLSLTSNKMITRKRKKSIPIEKSENHALPPLKSEDSIIAIEDLYATSSSNVCSSSLCTEQRNGEITKKEQQPHDDSEFMKKFKMEYYLIKEYRTANLTAPVDTMGCASLSDKDADEKVQRFQILVSLMLSSQTKDEITAKAIKKLKENNALSVSQMDELSEEEIQNLIYPVGFYKRKATYLKKVCKILKEKYDSDIPNDVKGLQSLPGVGPKMAYLCMSTAWKQGMFV